MRLFLGEAEPFVILSASEAGCQVYRLPSFESRYLAENGRPHPSPGLGEEFCGLRTDLHCHFAGCLLGQDLLDLALQEDLSYPRELLRDLGLATGEGQVSLRSLPIKATLLRM